LGTWTDWDSGVLEICLSVNGEIRQLAKTDLMVRGVESLLFHLNKWYGLSSGDYIWTGTPKGVGRMFVGDQVNAWMKNSDGNIVSRLNAKCIN
jgi:2-keto-4-pentenoate hydratase/2-oxohepta-3-ene-1,7-dioic acid hydratase in catechol pathway